MNPIGELIEVISRRAGLGNVGDGGVSMKKSCRGTSDDVPEPTAAAASMVDSVNPETSPSAGMKPQDRKWGEEVNVGG